MRMRGRMDARKCVLGRSRRAHLDSGGFKDEIGGNYAESREFGGLSAIARDFRAESRGLIRLHSPRTGSNMDASLKNGGIPMVSAPCEICARRMIAWLAVGSGDSVPNPAGIALNPANQRDSPQFPRIPALSPAEFLRPYCVHMCIWRGASSTRVVPAVLRQRASGTVPP